MLASTSVLHIQLMCWTHCTVQELYGIGKEVINKLFTGLHCQKKRNIKSKANIIELALDTSVLGEGEQM